MNRSRRKFRVEEFKAGRTFYWVDASASTLAKAVIPIHILTRVQRLSQLASRLADGSHRYYGCDLDTDDEYFVGQRLGKAPVVIGVQFFMQSQWGSEAFWSHAKARNYAKRLFTEGYLQRRRRVPAVLKYLNALDIVKYTFEEEDEPLALAVEKHPGMREAIVEVSRSFDQLTSLDLEYLADLNALANKSKPTPLPEGENVRDFLGHPPFTGDPYS